MGVKLEIDTTDYILVSALIGLLISFLATPMIGIIAGAIAYYWLRMKKKREYKLWL